MRLTALTILLILLTACGAGSRPFQHEGTGATRLAAPPEGLSLLVVPLPGTGPDAAAAMAEALRLADVPASTEYGASAGYRLSGAKMQDSVAWQLATTDGRALAEVRSPVTSADPQAPEPGFHAAAGELARVIRTHQTADLPGGTVGGTAARLHLAAATGAPGDGERALPLAMRSALADTQIELIDADAPAAFTLEPQVRVGAAQGDVQPVEIVWVLSRDGAEIGRLAQRNAVPAGSLEARWGATAVLAARAAAPGVSELIAEALR